jgi:hypothetical protein
VSKLTSNSMTSTTGRTRRRLAAWATFGAVGLATGAVWATGFADSTAVSNPMTDSSALTKTAPVPDPSHFQGVTTDVAPLTIDWDGRWGAIGADTVLFQVDLTDARFDATFDYNIATLLANRAGTALTGWSSLQLEVRLNEAAGANCVAGDLAGADAADVEVLRLDDQDAGVYWNTLPGGEVYCIGVAQSDGDDVAGTFLRAADETEPSGQPMFITTVDRTA